MALLIVDANADRKCRNFMDSERFETPKMDCVLQRQRIISACIPGLLTLKIQGSVPPKDAAHN